MHPSISDTYQSEYVFIRFEANPYYLSKSNFFVSVNLPPCRR